MADNKCGELTGSAVETVVLAFDLAGYEAKSGPGQVLKALENEKVQKAIEDALTAQAKTFLGQQKKKMPIDAGKALEATGKAVGTALLSTGTGDVKKQIQQSPPYLRLEKHLDELKCAYEKSVIGAWVDEHKLLLLIVASGVALGGATAMYLTNTGDTPADWATSLLKDKIKTTVLGKLELGIADVKFTPSKRDVGLTGFMEVKKWKFLKDAKLDLNVQVTDGKVVHAGGTLQSTIALGQHFEQSSKLTVDPASRDYALSLGISGSQDGLTVKILAEVARHQDKNSLTAEGSLGYTTKVGGVPLHLDASLGTTRNWGTGTLKSDVHAQVGLSIDFDFPK